MTRRERLERKLERRRDWAESRARQAAAASTRAFSALDGIPPGQPILVGHHSERHHRAALARSDRAMSAAVENSDMAKHHEAKAHGLEIQLERTIFSDDEDAPERIRARIAELEAKVERRKAVNAAFRKAKGAPGWAAAAGLSPATEAAFAKTQALAPWVKAPVETYEFSNVRNNIRRLKGRLQEIEERAELQAAADAAPGGLMLTEHPSGYVSVTFAEKPDREVLHALKAAGFWWKKGRWTGEGVKLPVCVRELLEEARRG